MTIRNWLTTAIFTLLLSTSSWAQNNNLANGNYYIKNVATGSYLCLTAQGGIGTSSVATEIELSNGISGYTLAIGGNTITAALQPAVSIGGNGQYNSENVWNITPSATVGNAYTIGIKLAETYCNNTLTALPAHNSVALLPQQSTLDEALWVIETKQEHTMQVVTLDETKENKIINQTGVELHLKRTFALNEWNTLVLPFSMSRVQIAETFGNDAKVAVYSAMNDDNLEFTTTQKIEAGRPCIIWPTKKATVAGGVATQADEYYLVENVDITATIPTAEKHGDLSFLGSYSPYTAENGSYVIYDNKVFHLSKDMQSKGFRARLKPNEGSERAKAYKLSFGDSTSGIAPHHTADSTAKHTVYDLNGRKQPTLRHNGKPSPKGVYVVDGVKIIVK